jgi:hypothetical protein
MRRFLVGLVALLLCAAGGQQKLRSYHPIPTHVDARVEAVARAICRARGINPDHVGPPFPQGPLWEFYIPQAVEFVDEYDALMHFIGPDVMSPLPSK